MSPWADEFAAWRRSQGFQSSRPPRPQAEDHTEDDGSAKASGQQPDASYQEEDVNGLEETKGCAILDSGATVMCSSTIAAEEIHMQRINRSEPGQPTVSQSDRRFRFADGRVDEAQKVVEQPITSGL